MLIVWSGWWWLRKTWVTASGATPSAASGSRISDAPGDHPGVDDDQRVAVADEDDAAADAVAGVAGVEEVDGGHRRMLASARRGPGRSSRRTGCARSRRVPCNPRAMTHDGPADLVLRGGRVATMDAAGRSRRPWPSATAGSSRSGATGTSRPWIGPRTRVVELRGPDGHPGLRGRPRPPGQCGLGRMRCDLPTTRGARTPTSRSIAAYAAAHPDEPWIRGDGWSMADFPGGIPHREDLDRVVPGPAGLPREPRRPHGLGQHAGRSSWPGITADDARPGRRPDRARRRRPADRHAPRGRRRRSSSACSRRRRPRSWSPACASPRPSSTRSASPHWQDAIVEPERERDRLHDARRPWRADRPGRRRAVVGPRARRRADRGARRAARTDGRSAATRRPASS